MNATEKPRTSSGDLHTISRPIPRGMLSSDLSSQSFGDRMRYSPRSYSSANSSKTACFILVEELDVSEGGVPVRPIPSAVLSCFLPHPLARTVANSMVRVDRITYP